MSQSKNKKTENKNLNNQINFDELRVNIQKYEMLYITICKLLLEENTLITSKEVNIFRISTELIIKIEEYNTFTSYLIVY